MPIRIVCNKKLDMTDDEFKMYENIIRSYTSSNVKGEDLFIDLFESNNEGIITFLIPPSKRQTSLEIFLFLMSLQQHQLLRKMFNEVEYLVKQLKEKIEILDKKIG
jgi:hypothetical protein